MMSRPFLVQKVWKRRLILGKTVEKDGEKWKTNIFEKYKVLNVLLYVN